MDEDEQTTAEKVWMADTKLMILKQSDCKDAIRLCNTSKYECDDNTYKQLFWNFLEKNFHASSYEDAYKLLCKNDVMTDKREIHIIRMFDIFYNICCKRYSTLRRLDNSISGPLGIPNGPIKDTYDLFDYQISKSKDNTLPDRDIDNDQIRFEVFRDGTDDILKYRFGFWDFFPEASMITLEYTPTTHNHIRNIYESQSSLLDSIRTFCDMIYTQKLSDAHYEENFPEWYSAPTRRFIDPLYYTLANNAA